MDSSTPPEWPYLGVDVSYTRTGSIQRSESESGSGGDFGQKSRRPPACGNAPLVARDKIVTVGDVNVLSKIRFESVRT